MIGIVVAAVLVVLLSLSVGQLVAWLAGARRWTAASAPVGFAALALLGPPAMALPGRMTSAAIAAGLLGLAGIVLAARRRAHRPPWWLVPVTLPAAALALLPFAANGRAGLLGVSFNNDTAAHLLLVETMRSAAVAEATPLLPFYPVGPHGVAGFVASGTGLATDVAYTGMLVALPVLMAIAALTFLGELRPWARAIVATLTALPYLAASYFAQGAFKEIVLMLLLLGMAATLHDAARSSNVRRLVPLAVVLAGVLSSYSLAGLAWAGIVLILVGAVWLVRRLRTRDMRVAFAQLVPAAAFAGLVGVVLLIPQIPRMHRFYEWSRDAGIAKDDIGNLVGPIDPAEALGIWLQPDFRFAPVNTLPTTLWSIAVGILLVLAIAWWLRRREPIVPLVLVACAVVWLASEPGQSPYTVAKAIAVASPFVLLIVGRALFAGRPGRPAPVRWGLPLLGLVIAAAATWSTIGVMRNAQVGPTDRLRQLESLRGVVEGQPTVYLGFDDFAGWALRGAPVTLPNLTFEPFGLREEKAWQYGQSYDIDTVEPETLDRFRFVVTARDPAASTMPENFRRVADTRDYVVYERTGPTRPRDTLAEGQQGAAVLDCATPEGRAIARRSGVAGVRGPTVTVGFEPMTSGSRLERAIPLTSGTWDLSLRYTSSQAIRIQIGGLDRLMPAAMERAGSVWPVGSIRVTKRGSIPVRLTADETRLGLPRGDVAPTELVAQRRGGRRTVSLAAACSRNVDWYRAR